MLMNLICFVIIAYIFFVAFVNRRLNRFNKELIKDNIKLKQTNRFNEELIKGQTQTIRDQNKVLQHFW